MGFVRHFHEIDTPAHPEVTAGLEHVARSLQVEGAEVRDIRLPSLVEFGAVNRVILQSEAWSIHEPWLKERPGDYGRLGRQRLMAGAFMSAGDYMLASRRRLQMIAEVEAAFREVDVLLCASSMDPACRIEDTAEVERTYPRQARTPFNVTGHPALAMMAGLSVGGLPVSVQFVGRYFDEATVFQVARAWERVAGTDKSTRRYCDRQKLFVELVLVVRAGLAGPLGGRNIAPHDPEEASPRRLHAPRQHPHRGVALSRRHAGRQLQSQALVTYAQTLERGKFDAFFMADHLAVLNMPMEALKRSATVTSFDPLTLLPALAMATKHLGLIATASTTFEPAYTIARRFASLDHISEGRAGWNLVTTANPDAALNFGWTTRCPMPSATPAPANSSTWSRACGIPGPTMPSSGTSRTASTSIRRDCTCSTTRAST